MLWAENVAFLDYSMKYLKESEIWELNANNPFHAVEICPADFDS